MEELGQLRVGEPQRTPAVAHAVARRVGFTQSEVAVEIAEQSRDEGHERSPVFLGGHGRVSLGGSHPEDVRALHGAADPMFRGDAEHAGAQQQTDVAVQAPGRHVG